MKRIYLPLIIGLFLQIAEATPSVAVSQLAANGVSESEAASLTDALRNELIKSGQFQVLERSQMENILKEQGFQQSGLCDEAACAVEIGKMLSVNQVFLGSIGKVGKTYTLTVRVVDVNTGKVLQGVTENYKGEVDRLLTDIIPMVASKLFGTYKNGRKQSVASPIDGSIPMTVDKNAAGFRSRNLVLGGVGVVLAAAGAAALFKANKYQSQYNAYVPGDADFNAAGPAERQDKFDYLRGKYNTFLGVGLACLGLAAADGVILALTVRF